MVQVSPSDTFIRREITYTGSWYYADEDYPEMVRLLRAVSHTQQLATHTFPAGGIDKAYQRFVSRGIRKGSPALELVLRTFKAYRLERARPRDFAFTPPSTSIVAPRT